MKNEHHETGLAELASAYALDTPPVPALRFRQVQTG